MSKCLFEAIKIIQIMEPENIHFITKAPTRKTHKWQTAKFQTYQNQQCFQLKYENLSLKW